MDIERFREYCLSKPGVTEGMPFGEGVVVFKVLTKMFATLSLSFPSSTNLKCDPEKAIELRAAYPAIGPGYHMNKKHWNTLSLEENLTDTLIKELVTHSYELVSSKLTKKQLQELANLQ